LIRALAQSVLALALCVTMNAGAAETDSKDSRRVPAEWEPREAVWLQWPGSYERVFQPAIARMSAVISRYQKLNILCDSGADEARARQAITAVGGDPDHVNILLQQLPNDSAWVRDLILGQVSYLDRVFDTNYLNSLVGNSFVIAVGFGDAETDAAARKRIEGYFPGRDVHIIEMLASWYDGGGVHCQTNDQPAL
jgi:agmatine/peptidylarginine deiminase